MKRYLPVLAIAVAALVAGCGGGADAGPPASAPPKPPTFNDTDVMFLQMMIPHHREALEIVRLGKERAVGAEVKTLAAAVEATQTDEVDSMAGWLAAWGKPTNADPNPSLHAHHGGMRATGKERIEALRKTKPAQFDRTFLNLLIGHQHNAVELARMEVDGGVNLHAKDLARRIDESRRAQISLMLRYLSKDGA
jgi:uncharacterized protein (DUF305 family)